MKQFPFSLFRMAEFITYYMSRRKRATPTSCNEMWFIIGIFIYILACRHLNIINRTAQKHIRTKHKAQTEKRRHKPSCKHEIHIRFGKSTENKWNETKIVLKLMEQLESAWKMQVKDALSYKRSMTSIIFFNTLRQVKVHFHLMMFFSDWSIRMATMRHRTFLLQFYSHRIANLIWKQLNDQ